MYYKTMSGEYIAAVGMSGEGCIGWAICSDQCFEAHGDFIEIEETEHKQITTAIEAKPHAEGKGYRLKADLTWEEYDLPPEPDPDLDDSELLNILMGVTE